MKRLLASSLGALILSATGAVASTSVGNAGSAYRCGDAPLEMAEHLISKRGTPLGEIEDREAFIHSLLARIPLPEFRKIVSDRWKLYGNSETWPKGDLSKVEVYYYVTPTVALQYGDDGRIPAANPKNSICNSPQYDPDTCCDRVLISFFQAEGQKPTRLRANYRMLSRYERNVLELHEAIFRSARELGQIPPPSSFPTPDDGSIREYRAWKEATGELPSSVLLSFTSSLLRADAGDEQIAEDFRRFWQWSRALYGPERFACR